MGEIKGEIDDMTPPFPSSFEEVVFWVVFATVIGSTIFVAGRGARRSRAQQQKTDIGDVIIINLAAMVSLVIGILLAYARIGVLPDWLFYPGLILESLGAAFGLWASTILGRFYAPIVQTQVDHKVIDKGPYHYIRHPMYAGGLLSVIGIGLALQSWPALLVIVIVPALGWGNRIRIEEKFLVAELGNNYVEYMRKTKRLIPFVL